MQARWKRNALGVASSSASSRPTAAERVQSYAWQENDWLTKVADSMNPVTRFKHDAVGNLFQMTARQNRRYGRPGSSWKHIASTINTMLQQPKKVIKRGGEWHYAWNSAEHLVEVLGSIAA